MTCDVCGQPGEARLCGCDGLDPICHLAPCDTVCARCESRAQVAESAIPEEAPEPREVVEPCILEVQKGCGTRRSDVKAALAAYRVLGLDKHSKASFAADVLFGHFENVRLVGEAPLDEQDDFRHKTRCWICWPPRPRSASQWCIHPHQLWTLREPHRDQLRLADLAEQILSIEKARTSLLSQVPKWAGEMITRRLANLVAIAYAVSGGEKSA